MKKIFFLLFALFVFETKLAAQATPPLPGATETIQPSQSGNGISLQAKTEELVGPVNLKSQSRDPITIKIPAGTSVEVEVAYTVSSLDVKPGELLSFRVLIPILVDGVIAIDKDALVTARVTLAKRGGHWGKAGRLAWAMEDVVAADNTRVLLDPAPHSRNERLWNLERKGKDGKDTQLTQGSVKGTSHKKEVATRTVIAAVIFPPLAPLALMHGFRRGENAVLPEGKRFVVAVRNEASVSVTPRN